MDYSHGAAFRECGDRDVHIISILGMGIRALSFKLPIHCPFPSFTYTLSLSYAVFYCINRYGAPTTQTQGQQLPRLPLPIVNLSYDSSACTINGYTVVTVTCMRKERKLRLRKAMKDGR